MFYTNCQQVKNNILVCGVKDGQRYLEKVSYKPYLFVKSDKETKYKTIHEEPVSKIEFDNIFDAKEFHKSYNEASNVSVYGFEKFVYVYMSDYFKNKIPYDKNHIVEWFLDIETIGDGSFPDIETANQEIVAITVRIKDTRWVFGLKDFQTTDSNIIYVKFKSEIELLQAFVNFIRSPIHRPDVITGWYIDGFDIPYIINRITNELGMDAAKSMSPWNILKTKEIETRGRKINVWTILGISILDYIDLYKKFTQNKEESYTLDYISNKVLGVGKLDYSEYESLTDLYEKNPQLFLEYNVIDVDRVYEIDQKLRFLDRVYAIAYDAKVNYNDALTSVLLWDVIIHNDLMSRNIVVPPLKKHVDDRKVPGGYVKEPESKMYNWVISLDIQSLYPFLIQQYNISPDTFVKNINIETYDDNQYLYEVDKVFNIISEIREDAVKNNYSITANGCLYRKDKQGFLSRLMEEKFEQRSIIKKRMIETKKENAKNPSKELENEIARLDAAQNSAKTLLNSAYGALANQYFRHYSFENASAITVSGQMTTKNIGKKVNEYLNKVCNTENYDFLIASDTDSCYINCEKLVDQLPKTMSKKEIVDFLDKFSKKRLEPFIAKCFKEHADFMNAHKSALHMKREIIAEKAVWRAKKNYIMSVWDNEGVRYDKPEIKTSGVESVRSSTPKVCREALEECYEILMNKNEENMIDFIDNFKKKFYSMSFLEIARPSGVSELSKFVDKTGKLLHKKGAPGHVKACLVYNDQIKKHKLVNKYNLIADKDKVRWCYMIMPNTIHSPVFAVSKEYPKELNITKYIDYKKQYEKTFLFPVTTFLDIVGWKSKATTTLENFFE